MVFMVMCRKTPSRSGDSKRRIVNCLAMLLTMVVTVKNVPAVFAELQQLDHVVAIVNDGIIMSSELEAQVSALSRQMIRSQSQIPSRDVIVPQVLNKLIQDTLQLEIGQRAGVQISDVELNEAMTDTAKRQNLTLDEFLTYAREDGLTQAQLRLQFKKEMIISRVQQAMVNRRIEITEQEINNFLNSEEGKLMSSAEVNIGHILLRLSPDANVNTEKEVISKAEALRLQLAEGADFKQLALINSAGPNALKGGQLGWRKAAQLPALFTQALNTLSPGQFSEVLRSDAGVHLLMLYDRRGGDEQLIEQSEVRHILIKPNEIRSNDEARQLAASLRSRIIQGELFEDLARQYSEDTGSALKGGQLGWSVPGQFVVEFENTANGLEVGIVSEPVMTEHGWHIIEVTGRRKQDFSDEILRNQAANYLRQRKYAEELQVWLEEIRNEAFIEIKS
ncbi:MAG: molecular chaperone SurA [Gammaproteobacteria bacterium]|nr:MAG: molecular chaperone SurA [Gammaproteobacteria bacterium]RLA54565.1 MAG: molecular chaperone SurA [Gammaproteobacteria bacterium]